MTFDPSEILFIVSPVTVAVSILAGVTLSTVLRVVGVSGRAPALLFVTLVVVGWSFLGLIAASRAMLGSQLWEAYIGTALLWAIYSGSASIAMRVRFKPRA